MYKCNSNYHFLILTFTKREGNFPTGHQLRILPTSYLFPLFTFWHLHGFCRPCSISVLGGKHQNVQFCEAPVSRSPVPLRSSSSQSGHVAAMGTCPHLEKIGLPLWKVAANPSPRSSCLQPLSWAGAGSSLSPLSLRTEQKTHSLHETPLFWVDKAM